MTVSHSRRGKTRFRAPRLLSALGAALFALVMALMPSPASAHGVAIMPGSRTYLCYTDLVAHGSTQMPANPACAAAVQATGTNPLYNWFAVLDSNGGGRTTGYIPDGELCSGGHSGPFNFASYRAARTDWPKTHLTSGSTIQLQYSNWAAHPGKFNVYITKNGWSPTTPLAWGDLQLLQTVTNPPQVGSPGSNGGHYYWNQPLPSGKSGQHMLFIHWIRSDSQENFYSCSDIVFDGGSGQVTGLGSRAIPSADLAAAALSANNTHAAPIHEHGVHAASAATVGRISLASSTGSSTGSAGSDGSAASPLATVSMAGALAVVASGAMLYGRRRRHLR